MKDKASIALSDRIESDCVEPDERILAERRRYRDAPADILPLRDVDVKELDQTLFKEIYLPAAVGPDVLAENSRIT